MTISWPICIMPFARNVAIVNRGNMSDKTDFVIIRLFTVPPTCHNALRAAPPPSPACRLAARVHPRPAAHQSGGSDHLPIYVA